MRPVIHTHITHHTVWQALVGDTPPLSLPAAPIAKAVLDNRDVGAGDLFVALVGENTDGHRYIDQALQAGASVIICEAHGAAAAQAQNALILDCSLGVDVLRALLAQTTVPLPPLAYIVPSSLAALQKIGAFQRLHRCAPALRVIGVTGSVGKSTTKELAASVLRQRFQTLYSQGSLNNEQGLPFTLMGLGLEHERAVLEMGTYGLGEIHDLCTWARPHVGVVTNIGPVHLERMGSIENIVRAKGELLEALPTADQGGVAILNWDDERVRDMAALTQARLFRYGLSPAADLWADEIEGAGMEGIRFRFHYRHPLQPDSQHEKIDSLHVRVPLLGRHSVHTALRAAAVGLVEGLSWEEIVAALQSSANQLRLVVMAGINDSTVIDDTYNASPASTIAALNLLDDLAPSGGGRRVAVLGDMLELGPYEEEGHKLVGRRAADVVELLVTIGQRGSQIAQEALAVGLPPAAVYQLSTHTEAIALLQQEIQPGDLILVKGSRAVGMDTVAAELYQ